MKNYEKIDHTIQIKYNQKAKLDFAEIEIPEGKIKIKNILKIMLSGILFIPYLFYFIFMIIYFLFTIASIFFMGMLNGDELGDERRKK